MGDFHSIKLDGSSDVSNKEQAVFCCRCVDDELVPYEELLSLHGLETADATTITSMIRIFFFVLVLILRDCGAMLWWVQYDDAS